MDLDSLTRLSPSALKRVLPAFLSEFVSINREKTEALLEELVNSWTDEDLLTVHQGLGRTATAGEVQRTVAPCQAVSRRWSEAAVTQAEIHGLDHLVQAMESGPTVILSNHLSYFDATATDAIIAKHAPGTAGRIVYAAGPKVYQSLFRRVAAAGLNTLPVPQSSRLSHTETIPPRELARLIHASLDAAQQLLADGNALLIYPEGSRSRTGHLQPFIAGVHRYIKSPGLKVVPLAIIGTQGVMPVGARCISPGPVSLTFAPPVTTDDGTSSKKALEQAYFRIAELLPPSHQPLTGQSPIT